MDSKLLMDPFEFTTRLQSRVHNLKHTWKRQKDNFELNINDDLVQFRFSLSSGLSSPDQWLQKKHDDGAIHEPGLISVWVLLSEYFSGPVCFIDIGALFGYHSAIFSQLCGDSICILVEGNKKSLCSAKEVNASRQNFIYKNFFVETTGRKSFFFIDGYNFYRLRSWKGLSKISFSFLKNILKSLLNMIYLGDKPWSVSWANISSVESVSILELINDAPIKSQIVLKIDTEGHQVDFLKGQFGVLFRRGVVICMELDSPKKMKSFNGSNKFLIDELIFQGFSVVWLDHRNPKDVLVVKKFKEFMNCNSLIVAWPNS